MSTDDEKKENVRYSLGLRLNQSAIDAINRSVFDCNIKSWLYDTSAFTSGSDPSLFQERVWTVQVTMNVVVRRTNSNKLQHTMKLVSTTASTLANEFVIASCKTRYVYLNVDVSFGPLTYRSR